MFGEDKKGDGEGMSELKSELEAWEKREEEKAEHPLFVVDVPVGRALADSSPGGVLSVDIGNDIGVESVRVVESRLDGVKCEVYVEFEDGKQTFFEISKLEATSSGMDFWPFLYEEIRRRIGETRGR